MAVFLTIVFKCSYFLQIRDIMRPHLVMCIHKKFQKNIDYINRSVTFSPTFQRPQFHSESPQTYHHVSLSYFLIKKISHKTFLFINLIKIFKNINLLHQKASFNCKSCMGMASFQKQRFYFNLI